MVIKVKGTRLLGWEQLVRGPRKDGLWGIVIISIMVSHESWPPFCALLQCAGVVQAIRMGNPFPHTLNLGWPQDVP